MNSRSRGFVDGKSGGEDHEELDIVDETDLGAVSGAEAKLLAETVELAQWEKRRIIAVLRTLKRGRYFEFLGVSPNASRRELKRAYRELSKEYHPDRYYGRKLGSYQSLLNHIFQTATEVVQAIYAKSAGPGGPRRRLSNRFSTSVKAQVQCSSWAEPLETEALDVSEGGMFIVTSTPVERGTPITVRMQLPNHGFLHLQGRVAWSRSPEQAERHAHLPGLGISLDDMSESERTRFALLLVEARRIVPVPDESVAGEASVARVWMARGSRPVRRPATIVGIDLGTTYTSVAAARDGRVQILRWPSGERAIPSAVAFPGPGRYEVGEPARSRQITDPAHVVTAAKRLLGRRASEYEIESHLAQAAYQSTVDDQGEVLINMWGERYAIAQLCSYLLRAARENAERVLGHAIDRAVLTAPVTFDEHRAEMLRRAARVAQIEVVEILDEPSAAALANRYHGDFGGMIGVYDFGGGTFDFSVVDASAGDFRVLDTGGDGWLGGEDFDLAMADAIAEKLWRTHGIDLRDRVVEWQVLLMACERAKRSLSGQEVAEIVVPEVTRTVHGPQDLRMKLRRVVAETLWEEPIRRSLATCSRVLERLEVQPQALSGIYLSGGTSYIPAVQRALTQAYGVPVRVGVPPEYAACLGAGIHGAQLDLMRRATLRGR